MPNPFTAQLTAKLPAQLIAQLIASTSTLSFMLLLSNLAPAHAQTPNPLKAVASPSNELTAIAHSINAQAAADRAAAREPDGLALTSLPIVGDFIHEDGSFDMGVDLPFAFNIGDVMGETGMVLSVTF